MVDLNWLRDVLETLRGVLLRLKGRHKDSDILMAITLTEATILMLVEIKGGTKGADDS